MRESGAARSPIVGPVLLVVLAAAVVWWLDPFGGSGVVVHVRLVDVHLGRSSFPISPASGGSATAHTTGPATRSAALDARAKLLAVLAEQLDAEPDELDIDGGEILLRRQAVMRWEEACPRIAGEKIVGMGRWDRQARRRDKGKGHARGVQFVDLRVDAETGVITAFAVVTLRVSPGEMGSVGAAPSKPTAWISSST